MRKQKVDLSKLIKKKIEQVNALVKKTFFTRLSTKEQTFFVKRLSFLVKAGIPIREALVMIREQTRKKNYALILDKVIDNISNGQSLAASLSRLKNTFSDFAINIIDFGEQGGILPENLEYVAEELKKKQALRKKIISAMIYPAIITVATLLITIFLMVYLFPKIIPIFVSIRTDLPLSTQIVIFISNFIKNYGLVSLVILIIISAVFVIITKRNPKIRLNVDKFILKVPLVGKIVQGYNIANFTRTMGLLLKSGVTMNEALPIGAKVTSNSVYKKEFKTLAGVANRGEKISTYLIKQNSLFPEIVPQIISVGEYSGNLSNSLIYLSEMYEAELEDLTKNVSSLIEPALMVFMGILVGFVAISIIAPIYGITQHLSPR